MQGFSVAAWPTTALTSESSAFEAERVAGLLLDAFSAGVESEHYGADRRHPRRVPLYAYVGVPPGQPATALIGWLRVLDVAVGSISDPDDESVFVVVADVRVTWSAGVGLPPGPPVQAVPITTTGA